MAKLTDRNSNVDLADSDLVHVVDVSNKTDSVKGTSSKVTFLSIFNWLRNKTWTFTQKATFNGNINLPLIPNKYLKTGVSGDIEGIDDVNTIPSGGSTGQVLAKDTNTDYDVSWQDISIPTINDASTTVKGIIEIGTDAEVQTGTDSVRAVVSSSLAAWWTYIKTLAHTFAAKITFTSAPRFSSVNANEVLKVDANKDLTSIAIQDNIADSATLSAGTYTLVNGSILSTSQAIATPTVAMSGSLICEVSVGQVVFKSVNSLGTIISENTSFNFVIII